MGLSGIARPWSSQAPSHGRARPIAELLVVVGLLEAELWSLRATAPSWVNVLVYAVIVGVLGLSQERRRREGLAQDGRTTSPGRGWAEIMGTGLVLGLVMTLAAVLVGDSNETFEFLFLDKTPLRLTLWLAGKFAAALGQQMALQFFLGPICFELTRSRTSSAVLAAAIFGLLHLPSPTLVAITTLAGLVWVVLYRRSAQLIPLIVCHMILATLAHGELPERLTYDMRVGQSALADMKRFEELNDPRIRLINRRLKEHRAALKHHASEAYYQSQGGTLPGLIRGLFRDLLGREATEADVAFWVDRKLAHPRVDLTNIVLASDEYAALERARKLARAQSASESRLR